MFNVGQFNLKQFNVGMQQEEDILHSVSGHLIFKASAGVGQDTHDTVFGGMALSMKVDGAAGVLDSVKGGLQVEGQIFGLIDFKVRDEGAMDFLHTSTLGMDSYPTADGGLDFTEKLWLGCNIHDATGGGLLFSKKVELSVCIHEPQTYGEFLWWSQISSIKLDITNVTLNVQIPPGGTLIIDSNKYVVLLNGENAMNAHRGGWLYLTRDTYDVAFRPMQGTAKISTQILYDERWL